MTNRRSKLKAAGALSIGIFFVFVFVWLGVWQIQRLGWKLDLIDAVEARAYGEPIKLNDLNFAVVAEQLQYQRVEVSGRYLPGTNTLVRANTSLGPGYWLMTALKTSDDGTFWINRGFVPSEKAAYPTPADERQIVGLLRATEPDGMFLRPNLAQDNQWFSRDVAALNTLFDLTTPAFFIDVEYDPDAERHPRGGLTILKFKNNHLVYALTWFGMAGLLSFLLAYAAILKKT